MAPFKNEPREKILVTSFQGRPLAVSFVGLQVHGSTQPPTEAVLASGHRPLKDKREMVVLCWLIDPSPQFQFLTNDEARERWHQSGERFFYGTHDEPMSPDPTSILKILQVSRAS